MLTTTDDARAGRTAEDWAKLVAGLSIKIAAAEKELAAAREIEEEAARRRNRADEALSNLKNEFTRTVAPRLNKKELEK